MAKLSWLPKMLEPGNGGDGLLAGVDQVGVDLVLGRERADAQHAVLGLQPHLHVGGHVVGHQRGHADAQVHVEAVAAVPWRRARHLVLGPGHVTLRPFLATVRFSMRFSGVALCTMRCT
jgi:hypothetical protein